MSENVRTNSAAWDPQRKYWRVLVQRNGERKAFYSSIPGRAGKIACHQKADAWLEADAPVGERHRVADVYKLMLEHAEANAGTGNYVNLESIGRVWIIPRIGSRKMSDLALADMQRILDAAAREGRSYKTIRNIRGAMTAFSRFARLNRLPVPDTRDLSISKKAQLKGKSILTLDQVRILFSVDTTQRRGRTIPEWYINAFRLIVVIGLRPGELCELARKDQSVQQVKVVGSYNRFREHTDGKTKNAKRSVSLPQYGAQIMRAQYSQLKEAGIVSKYLFPRPDGEQTDSHYLYHCWRRYQEANGIEPALSLYELRHTFASLCRHSGVPEEMLKPVMGHSSSMPSYGIYGHDFGDETSIVAQIFEKSFRDILDETGTEK